MARERAMMPRPLHRRWPNDERPTTAYVSAACAAAVTLIAAFRGWGSMAIWFFTAGMVLLAAESVSLVWPPKVFSRPVHRGLGKGGSRPLAGMAFGGRGFLPAVWLLFSLSCARGDSAVFQ